ncbi:MAG TPA: alpha/beta hydrolase [Gallionella sp.]|nr:alpha/beta hydrolase [Gallionella sp.]
MTIGWTRRILISVAAIALLYAAGCDYMWATQRDHIFEPELALQTTPDRLGMKFDELRIPVGSGADKGELEAWWVPATHANEPSFLYLHGNDRNLADHLEHTLYLHMLGYNVLVTDYRGYGSSGGGKPSEAKVYQDAEAAWQYLIKVRGVKPGQAFIYGHSLGGAIAIDLAVHHPEAAGLITESTFTSMVAMGELKYGYLPVGLLLNQRFDSLKKISRLKIPVLLIHGTWDHLVPVRMAQQLYDAAPQPKTLILIKGGEHSNSATIGWIEYRDAVSAFVKKYAH